ncbi:MAG: hypothetical protein E4H17_01535 [Gemmatimonadales bacterium]|nr:MAG: hypothetical protein E4H17_01535 [Gemmatimonadales bacterium]
MTQTKRKIGGPRRARVRPGTRPRKTGARTSVDPALRLFDAYTRIGPATRPPLYPALSPADLLAEMDRCGADEALVSHAGFQISSVQETNRQVAAWCAGSPRLHPIWSILPPQTGEMELATLLPAMARAGVKVLQARPAQHRYILSRLVCGEMLDALTARHIPLILESDWPLVYAILKEFPSLTVIAVGHGCWGSDRFFRPLLETYENFHIDTATFELDGGLPALVRTYGATRIVYSSGYHDHPMGGASLLLRSVDIDARSRALIAHGNLKRLLDQVEL